MGSSTQTVRRPMQVQMIEDSLTAAKLTMDPLTRRQVAHLMT